MYESEALDPGHNIQEFDCGKPRLTDWLRNSALNLEAQHKTRTFVLCEGGDVLGYYSLVAHAIEAAEVPKKMRGNTRGQLPSVLLAKLALDMSVQGQGLGSVLLADAMGRVLDAAGIVGTAVVVVDAIDDDAAKFYMRKGFTPIPGNPGRLLQKISSIAAALGR